MNHYEELGIHQDATIEEIHEAYKLAARLLHPDNQREPRLKELAECQMKRLSGVLAILVNPQERARYDAGLANGAGLQTPPASGPELLQMVVRQWFWVLLGAVTLGMGVWYGLARGSDAPRGSAVAESARVPTAPVVAQNQPAPVKQRQVKTRRVKEQRADAAETTGAGSAELPLMDTVGQESELSVSATPATPADAPAEAAKEPQRGVPAVPKAEPADVAQGGGESRFVGEWLLNSADGREGDPAGAYPARYVEFRLREESGILEGDYRALHRVADKAISPEVVFRVRGESPAGNAGRLEWESSAGAKGELELTLRSPNQLRVTWWTTQFGRQQALSSGMALLLRLKTP